MTPTAQLVEIRLGVDLPGYLAEARRAGRSWRAIAAAITDATGVPVSHEVVRRWHADHAAAA